MVILFCHTSALIKLLINEPNSDQMEESSSQSEAIAHVPPCTKNPISSDDIKHSRFVEVSQLLLP